MNSIFENRLFSPIAESAFSDSNVIDAMLRFEAALARAQASSGLIAQDAAQAIVGTCKIDLFDVPKMVRESADADSIAIPFVKSLKETVGLFHAEAAAFVHFGCSNQDLMDSAMALLTRDALGLVEADIDRAVTDLLAMATRHASDPVLERSLLQAPSVTSFGLTCALWAGPLARSRRRLKTHAASALSVRWAGATGALAQGKEAQVFALMAADLALSAPAATSLTQRDEWVALACEVGLLIGSLGNMARGIALMAQREVAELSVSAGHEIGRLNSSRQEEQIDDCRLAVAAAQRTPQTIAALLTALSQESGRSMGDWQAALTEWPALLLSAHASANAIARTLSGLQVNVQCMRSNVEAQRNALPPDAGRAYFKPELMLQAAALAQGQVEALAAPRRITSPV